MDEEPVLKVENLSFQYRNGNHVLHDISFTLDEPGLTCIVGPNGVGKSTLIKCVNGLLKPTSGKVEVMGRDVSEYKLKELAKIVGYVPVLSATYNVMTVLDAVIIGRYARQKWRTTPEDIEIAHSALEAMEIDDLAMRNFNELSAGQHQKVSLARGLVQEPRIMLLDEPTSNLDVRHQLFVSDFLKRLSKKTGINVLMISHDLNLAAKFSDNLLVLEKPGRLYGFGKPSDIISEDMLKRVYNVESEVVEDHGAPHVVLQSVGL